MRRLSVRIAAAAAGALIMMSGSGPARADDEGWQRIPCFAGAIDEAAVSADGSLITLAGHVDCADPELGSATLGFARYHGEKTGVLFWSTMHPYGATAPTPASILKDLPAGKFAICLVTDHQVRVACVSVSPVPGAPAAVAPLATDDPLVDRTIEVFGRDSMPSPVCGTCW